MIITPFQKLLNRGLLRSQRTNEVARFDGIILADTQDSSLFRRNVLSALQLIKDLDSRRFRRLQRNITWIVNCPLPHGGGQYHYPTRTCRLDIEKATPELDPEYAAAAIASTLIHEATHGALRARGIGYSAQLRSRVERCCVKEQNRFIARLSLARDPTSQSFTIVNLPNRVGMVLGLQRVFRVCLILSAVLAVKRSNQALERTDSNHSQILRITE